MDNLKRNTYLVLILLTTFFFAACTQKSPTHYFKNGSAKFSLKDYKGAIVDLDKSIKLKNDFTDAFYVRAICYAELGEMDKAEEDFNKVLSLDANYKDVYVNRAYYIKESKMDFEGALEDYNKFIAMNKEGNNAFALNNRGFVKYKMDNYTEALNDVNASLLIDKKNAYAFKNRALIYFTIDSLQAACKDLERASELGYPTNTKNEDLQPLYEFCKK